MVTGVLAVEAAMGGSPVCEGVLEDITPQRTAEAEAQVTALEAERPGLVEAPGVAEQERVIMPRLTSEAIPEAGPEVPDPQEAAPELPGTDEAAVAAAAALVASEIGAAEAAEAVEGIPPSVRVLVIRAPQPTPPHLIV